MLGQHLGSARAGYGEIDERQEIVSVERDWIRDSNVASLAGEARILRAFGPAIIAELKAGHTLVVDDCLTDPRVGDGYAEAWESIGCRALVVVPLVRAKRLRAILYVHEQASRRWIASDVTLVKETAERTWGTLERARAEAAVRESEARFRQMADHAPVMMWVTDLTGYCTYLNRLWYEFTGQTECEAQGFGWLDATHPDDRGLAAKAFNDANAAQAPFRMEYRLRRADGHYRWCIDTAAPRLDENGTFLGYVGSVIDIDDRREAEERQELLSREVDHRAKNALAVVLAALRLTRAPDQPSFVRAIEGRVSALARAQTLLAEDRWAGADLKTLLGGELAPFLIAGEEGEPSAMLDGPSVALPAGAAQPLAMGIHELATNALKHGALSVAAGRLTISWYLVGTLPSMLCLQWVETGGPPVTGAPERRGFGSRVLQGTVQDQLGGKVTLDWVASGLVCNIEVPLRR